MANYEIIEKKIIGDTIKVEYSLTEKCKGYPK